MIVRPLTHDDVEAATEVCIAALPIPPEFQHGDRHDWVARRTRHMLDTDPGGAWVSEHDGAVTGVALAIVREGVWGLSMLAVDPERHARGTGTRLLEAALGHEGGGRGGIILSSTDPRAMRLYARAGFDLRPCVGFAGILDREAIPGGLRARASDHVEAAAALARPVRGGAYGADDLALLLTRPAAALLLIEGAGFVLHDEGSPIALAAADEAAAADLLWACFGDAPRGGTVHVDSVTAGQDWAVRVALQARLAVSPEGPLFTRGELGPLRPWLPSGAIL